jgi:hypothetical protein
MFDLATLTSRELLALHARVSDQLRTRGITRSSNNPVGDLAEHLFCKAFNWDRAGNSNANVDATDRDRVRYQIKGRRLTKFNKSRQLSSIREFEGAHFDFLAGVLFAEDYSVIRAGLIPYAVVKERATFVAHTNSHKFLLRDDVWESPSVRDVTEELRAVSL